MPDAITLNSRIIALAERIAQEFKTQDGKISAIPKFKVEVVSGSSLPATGDPATIYLLTTGDESGNLFTEYVFTNNAWEQLGTQTLDLSGYALKSNAISGLTVNGNVITVTKADGTSSTITIGEATKASQDGDGNVITSTYSTKTETVSSMSVSGTTLTYTKADGNSDTLTITEAGKATNDGNGDNIANTYFKKEDVGELSDYVAAFESELNKAQGS